MINIRRYFEKDKYKLEAIKEIKDSGKFIKAVTPRTTYVGKIEKYNSKEIMLKPYTNWENLPQENGSFLSRVRIEKEVGLPLKIKDITIEKTSEGYMVQFVLMNNYFNLKSSRNKNLASEVMKGYPFPDKELIQFLEGKSKNQEDKLDNLYSENKIGFKRSSE